MFSIKQLSHREQGGQGIRFMLISTLCFSIMQALIKLMPQFDSFQHVFFRSLIGWLLCVFYLKTNKISLIGKNSKLLILRGLVGSVSMFSFFYILTRIPFGSSLSLKFLSPIFASIFSVMFLAEKIKPVQWLFIIISFLGVIVLKGFDTRISNFDLGIGIMSAVFGGLLFIVIKKIGEDDHQLVILQYFMLISMIGSGIVCFSYWKTPNLQDVFGLLAIGVIGFFAQNYFTKAIQSKEDVSILSNLRYVEVGFALVIGYFLFGETYNLQSFLGIILIFSGLLLSLKFKASKVKSDTKFEIE